MTDENLIELLKSLSEDIRQMRMDMARLARDSYRQDIEKVANTPARQEMWRLCDGIHNNEEISKMIGVSLRAIQYFVQDAEKKGLIIAKKRGYPKRNESFDEIPSEWKAYKKPDMQPITNEQKLGEQPNE
ncbi:MAG: hypothetical protein Q8L34_03015 [Candidatus Woesearchaeota archaeon]|nr:hypothetical protein [Candidatus Woesearchaeota archaeon]